MVISEQNCVFEGQRKNLPRQALQRSGSQRLVQGFATSADSVASKDGSTQHLDCKRQA